jgi:uncharacterized membrane protein YdjX (TVP38/TMEM64 family)
VRIRPAWALAALALLAVAAAFLPAKEWLRESLAWISVHRETSGLIYFVLYVAATVCFVPGLLLTLAGGALFGFAIGTVLVSASSVAGATAAFFVGRTLAREWIARRTAAWPRFRALDRALRARGFWIVLLTRLSPAFPYNLLNYTYGISQVRLRDYVLGSWLGMLPATALYVYAGAAAASLTQAASGRVQLGVSRWVLLGVGLAATAAVVVLVTRAARRQLDRELTV